MNTIGIDHNLDRPRIRKLLTIGLFASVLTGIGDFLLGYGESTAGSSIATSVMASAPNLADWQMIVGGLLGFFGIFLEGLACFAVYRLMADTAPKYAHLYRAGIFGYIWLAPVVYLCYKTGCDLKKSSRAERKLLLDAAGDAYHLLMALGYPVRPAGDEKSLEPGLMNTMVKLVIYWMSRTRLGALCTTEHCRHAPGEMEDLDEAFQALRAKKADFPISEFNRLRAAMPSWEQIRENYAG